MLREELSTDRCEWIPQASPPPGLPQQEWLHQVRDLAHSARSALGHAPSYSSRWAALTALGNVSAELARAVEPHLDASWILDECPSEVDLAAVNVTDASTWGVFAAEGRGVRVEASCESGQWFLTGVKPWCSLATDLSHALVTAWTSESTRRLFAVDLSQCEPDDSDSWSAIGLRRIRSLPVTFDRVPAAPVGPDDWYLQRQGFWWGGVGVAAVWRGAVTSLAQRLRPGQSGKKADQIALMHWGATDINMCAMDSLFEAAARVADGAIPVRADDPRRWALRTRTFTRGIVDEVVTRLGRALGPAPLAFDTTYIHDVADLNLYVQQDHAERDLVALGSLAIPGDE